MEHLRDQLALQSVWVFTGLDDHLFSAGRSIPRRRFGKEAYEHRVADDGELVAVMVAAGNLVRVSALALC